MIVKHSRGSYEIKATTIADALASLPAGSFVVTDTRVQAHYGHLVSNSISQKAVPEGEQSKSLSQCAELLDWLASEGADRHSTVVALGGGVVGDLAGFVGAIYMRGVRTIQIPTTLLAQVDSSVGGKVGVDLPSGKNLAGSFWPPSEVRLAIDSLQTLDERQFKNGMGEVWKYGLIMDKNLFDELFKVPLAPQDKRLTSVINRCIELKAQVVAEDEFETTGRRAILNFGHTVGHAIEHVTGYGSVLHGEAIAAGMIIESLLGENLGITTQGTTGQIRHAFAELNLPEPSMYSRDVDSLVSAMRRDKKAQGGSLAFSLLTEVGQCKLIKGVAESDVRKALEAL